MADDDNIFHLSNFSFGKKANNAKVFESDEGSNGELPSTPVRKKRRKCLPKSTGACWPRRVMASCEMEESDHSDDDVADNLDAKSRQSPTISEKTLSDMDNGYLPSSSNKKGKKKGPENSANKVEKFRWTEDIITDMVDLIANTTSLKKYLIFENSKNTSNGKHYETLVEGLNKRIATHKPPGPAVHATQARTKFKKLVSECRNVSLTIKTASGIDCHKVEKGYGGWWDILFRFVASKPSSDPSNNIEPTFEEEEQDKTGPSHTNSSTQTPPKATKMVPKRPNGVG
eukprot:gene2866-3314_t